MTMSLLMTIDSFFFLDSTSIGVYLSVSEIRGRCCEHRPDAPLLRKRIHTPPRGPPTDDLPRNPTRRYPFGARAVLVSQDRPRQHLSWRGQSAPSHLSPL